MTVYLRKLTKRDVVLGCTHEPSLGAWSVLAVCKTEDPMSCELLRRMKDMDVVDARALQSGLVKLLERCDTGQQLSALYDEKQCHEAFEYQRGHETEKVYRIWPGGNVRIYFCYERGKVLVLAFGVAKRKNTLSEGEKDEIAGLLRDYKNASDSNNVRIIEAKK